MTIDQKIERALQLSAYASLTQIISKFRSEEFQWCYQVTQQSGLVPYYSVEVHEIQIKIAKELRELSDGLWPKEK